ncbi:MAG: hypothetical protein GY845_09280 [Planctomycetes bacterium]|nr:hypothetical protein [Planctomycetota bacterium]
MDPFTSSFLAATAANLTAQVLSGLAKNLREKFKQKEKQQALKGCFEAAMVAMTIAAVTDVPEERDLLAEIFERFTKEPKVGRELAMLLRGVKPEIVELKDLFEQAGYDPETLPGLDFEQAMEIFLTAFLQAAAGESTLQGAIQTTQIMKQTGLQQGLLDGVNEIVTLLRQAQPGNFRIGPREVYITIQGEQKVVQLLPQDAVEPSDSKNQPLKMAYLNKVFESASRLSLSGLDPKAAGESKTDFNLDAVYTALLTQTSEEHDRMERAELKGDKTRRLSALAQLNRSHHLVLMGDPGSGKSTFVNFVAMCMAGEALEDKRGSLRLLTAPLPDEEEEDRENPQPWDHGALLPVHVILRDFAAQGLPPIGETAKANHLWSFIEKG